MNRRQRSIFLLPETPKNAKSRVIGDFYKIINKESKSSYFDSGGVIAERLIALPYFFCVLSSVLLSLQ